MDKKAKEIKEKSIEYRIWDSASHRLEDEIKRQLVSIGIKV